MAEDLSKWARQISDKSARLHEDEEWRKCLEVCDEGLRRLADADSAELIELRCRLRARRNTCAQVLRHRGETVTLAPGLAAEVGSSHAGRPAGPDRTEKTDRTERTGEKMAEQGTGTGAEKKCSKCGKTRPLDAFARNALSKDGHTASCKTCRAKATADRKKTAAVPAEVAPAPAAEPARPFVDPGELRRLTGEALAAIRSAAGCRTILEAGAHLMDATAAVVRIEQMVAAP